MYSTQDQALVREVATFMFTEHKEEENMRV
jgi:hypothetical protein